MMVMMITLKISVLSTTMNLSCGSDSGSDGLSPHYCEANYARVAFCLIMDTQGATRNIRPGDFLFFCNACHCEKKDNLSARHYVLGR